MIIRRLVSFLILHVIINISIANDKLLLFVDRFNLRSVNLETGEKFIILNNSFTNAISMDFHYAKQMIYISDVIDKKIYAIDLNGWDGRSEPPKSVFFDDHLGIPDGLAVDWIDNNLYWTDYGTKEINVINLESNAVTTIIKTDVNKPRGIALDLRDGEKWMYWTDWGIYPKIEKASLDGATRKIIVSDNIYWPNDITIDYSQNKLYWIDGYLNFISYSDLDGKNRVNILSSVGAVRHAFSLVIHNDEVYWTNWNDTSVKKANKITGSDISTITTELSDNPMKIQVYSNDRQFSASSSCPAESIGNCKHMCLLSQPVTSYTCPCNSLEECESPISASSNQMKAIIFSENDGVDGSRLVSFVGDPNVWIPTGKATARQITPRNSESTFNALAIGIKMNHLYASDHGKRRVIRVPTVPLTHPGNYTATLEKIKDLSQNQRINGLALDWISNNLYMVDTTNGVISICNPEKLNLCRNIITTDIVQPVGIAVHAAKGLLFWGSRNSPGKIEKSSLDGTNRQIIISSGVDPVGITIDIRNDHLYWVDGIQMTIRKCDFNGNIISNGIPLKSVTDFAPLQLWGLAIYQNLAIVSEQTFSKIYIVNLDTEKFNTLTAPGTPQDVIVMDSSQHPSVTNLCETLQCSDMCISYGPEGNARCLCREGFNLQSSGICTVAPEETSSTVIEKTPSPVDDNTAEPAVPVPTPNTPQPPVAIDEVEISPSGIIKTDPDDTNEISIKLPIWVIVGTVSGIVLIAVILVNVILCICCKKSCCRKRQERPSHRTSSELPSRQQLDNLPKPMPYHLHVRQESEIYDSIRDSHFYHESTEYYDTTGIDNQSYMNGDNYNSLPPNYEVAVRGTNCANDDGHYMEYVKKMGHETEKDYAFLQ